jgi:short-subunit dehydrogenase
MKDKVVIITGASSGIGLACVKEFYRLGARVVLAARSTDKMFAIQSSIDPLKERSLVVQTDVTKVSQCEILVEECVKKFGAVDILVNNAGISMRALFDDVELEVMHTVMNVNFWGTVYCTKYALPWILKSHGTICAITSIGGFHGLPGRTAYSASKFAIHGFMESIRNENMRKKIQILTLAASFTASNIRKSALDAHGNPQGETPKDEKKLDPPEKVARNLIRSIRKKKRNRIMSLEGQLMVLFQRIVPFLTDLVIYNKFASEPDSPLEKK